MTSKIETFTNNSGKNATGLEIEYKQGFTAIRDPITKAQVAEFSGGNV